MWEEAREEIDSKARNGSIQYMPKRIGDSKECTKCRKMKPYKDFYIDRSKADGHTYSCRECDSARSKITHSKYKKRYLETDREYYSKNRETILARHRKYRKIVKKKRTNLIKEASRLILRYAVKDGTIQKLPCVVCAEPKSEAHHTDYSKPLDVTWLCRKHHMEQHRLFPPNHPPH